MRRDPTEFRDRFKRWKKRELVYDKGLPKFLTGTPNGDLGTISTILSAFEGVPWKGYVNKTRTIIADLIKFAPTLGGAITSAPDIDFKTIEGAAAYGDVAGAVLQETGKSYQKSNGGVSTRTLGKGMYGVGKVLALPDMYYDLKKLYWDLKTPVKNYEDSRLPKFEDGKSDYKYILGGKDKQWTRITNDSMSHEFQDLIIRPKKAGGNVHLGSWKKSRDVHSEPGLEIVSPEFDILSTARGILNSVPKKPKIKSSHIVTDELWDDIADIRYAIAPVTIFGTDYGLYNKYTQNELRNK